MALFMSISEGIPEIDVYKRQVLAYLQQTSDDCIKNLNNRGSLNRRQLKWLSQNLSQPFELPPVQRHPVVQVLYTVVRYLLQVHQY